MLLFPSIHALFYAVFSLSECMRVSVAEAERDSLIGKAGFF